MKSFYGGSYIGKEELAKNNIYYPIRLEYYKTEELENGKTFYGVEIVKTDYKNEQIGVETKAMKKLTSEEKTIIKILDSLRMGTVTPIVMEEIVEDIIKIS